MDSSCEHPRKVFHTTERYYPMGLLAIWFDAYRKRWKMMLFSAISSVLYFILQLEIYNEVVFLILGAIIQALFGSCWRNRKQAKDRRTISSNTQETQKHHYIPQAVLGTVFTAICILILWCQYNYVIVPDVIGADYAYAKSILEEAGLKCNQLSPSFGDVVLIVSEEGVVSRGTYITLTVGRDSDSTGDSDENEDLIGEYEMPDLYLVSEEDAYKYLIVSGYTNVTVLYEYREDIVRGYVVKTVPVAGTAIDLDEEIVLYVSVNKAE